VCAGCHAKELTAWRGSDHDLAMQAAGREVGARRLRQCEVRVCRHHVDVLAPRRQVLRQHRRPRRQARRLRDQVHVRRAPAAAIPDRVSGRPHAGVEHRLGLAAESGRRAALVPPLPRAEHQGGDWLHWTSGGQNWNFTCAECHSTNLRKGFDAQADVYKTTWSELNVSCEACHGPASSHVAWAKKEGDWQALSATKGLAIALDERKGVSWNPPAEAGTARRSAPRTSARELDTCARCHGRAARLSDDYVHGKPPLDTHRLALLDSGLYWSDGQMREEVYNWGSFAQSRMHAQGVTCSDCHDPHSLKLRAQGNAVCAQCHQPAKFDAPSHTHHAAGTPGAACTSCHMPTTTYMVVDPRHDHSLRIPRPDLSVKLGVPNACNACHRKETPQWAADAIAKWTGKPPAGYQQFAAAFDSASAGAPGARGALLTLIDDPSQPAIVRASSLERLARLMTPTMLPSVSRALNDPDAVVRLAAVEALAGTEPSTRQRYLARMLGDPVRAVRSRRRVRSRDLPRRDSRLKIVRASTRRSPSSSPCRPTPVTGRRDGWGLRICTPREATRKERSPNIAKRSRSIPRSCRRTRISPTSTARAASTRKPRPCCAPGSRACPMRRRSIMRSRW
jgi:predicted CXXCH cytochrome family protein